MNIPADLQPTERTSIILPGGGTAELPTCRPIFSEWKGPRPNFDYGKKPILEYDGAPYFAELVILRLLLNAGWDGVWVGAYGGHHYLRTMPRGWNLQSEQVLIPQDKERFLQRIWTMGKTTACFDVLAWHDNQILFFEGKRARKDQLTAAQLKFIEGALACNISPDSMIIVEWTTRD